jgi:hypothetical protein
MKTPFAYWIWKLKPFPIILSAWAFLGILKRRIGEFTGMNPI